MEKTSWRLDYLADIARSIKEENPELAEWMELAISLKKECVVLKRENKRLEKMVHYD